MPEILKPQKPLSENPLKVSQPVGAILAFMGIRRAIPMLHGSQGCSAFSKVFFVRHFREPIPLQTTAMDQTSSVMGADDNVFQGLKTVIEKRKPALIGLPTTGLSETQGSDIQGLVTRFYLQNPELASTPVVPVVTPDFTGGLETGFALALEAMIQYLVPDQAGEKAPQNPRQINVLTSSMLTCGDLEYLKSLIGQFGFEAVMVPDISDSLDGHLGVDDFTPVTTGGTPVEDFARLGQARATLVIGRSVGKAADLLHSLTGVEDYRFDHLMGLTATDQLISTLHQLSGQPVPARIDRDRRQLQDAMLDTHFMLGMARVAVAADPDLLLALSDLLLSIGADLVAAVTSHNAPCLKHVTAEQVQIGDLTDLEALARARKADLILTNAHGAQIAERLNRPLLRVGWPVYDRIGAQHQCWIGYKGSMNTLIQLANLQLEQAPHHEIQPYVSVFAPESKQITAPQAKACADRTDDVRLPEKEMGSCGI